MTELERHEVQLALDNEWTDKLFLYYKTFIKDDAVRSEYETDDRWYMLKLQLRAKINESKTVLGPKLSKATIKVK